MYAESRNRQSDKTPVIRIRHSKHHVSVATVTHATEELWDLCSLLGPCRSCIWRTERDAESVEIASGSAESVLASGGQTLLGDNCHGLRQVMIMFYSAVSSHKQKNAPLKPNSFRLPYLETFREQNKYPLKVYACIDENKLRVTTVFSEIISQDTQKIAYKNRICVCLARIRRTRCSYRRPSYFIDTFCCAKCIRRLNKLHLRIILFNLGEY
jgi:hypothetical protein